MDTGPGTDRTGSGSLLTQKRPTRAGQTGWTEWTHPVSCPSWDELDRSAGESLGQSGQADLSKADQTAMVRLYRRQTSQRWLDSAAIRPADDKLMTARGGARPKRVLRFSRRPALGQSLANDDLAIEAFSAPPRDRTHSASAAAADAGSQIVAASAAGADPALHTAR